MHHYTNRDYITVICPGCRAHYTCRAEPQKFRCRSCDAIIRVYGICEAAKLPEKRMGRPAA